MPFRVRTGSRSVFAHRLSLLLLIAATAGCQDRDDIRSYTVPRATPKAPRSEAAAGNYRTLGAIFPSSQPTWFFKVSGSSDQIARLEPDFDAIVQSVRFPNGTENIPTFDIPPGAKKIGPRSVSRQGVTVRIDATVTFGPSDPELTLTKSEGGLEQNLARWAVQLGTPAPVPWGEVTRPIEADKIEGIRVDLRGPNDPARAAPFMKNR